MNKLHTKWFAIFFNVRGYISEWINDTMNLLHKNALIENGVYNLHNIGIVWNLRIG